MPLLAVTVVLESGIIPWVSGLSLVFLTLLCGLAAYVGGANILWGAIRITLCGALAMAATTGVGALFGTTGLAEQCYGVETLSFCAIS